MVGVVQDEVQKKESCLLFAVAEEAVGATAESEGSGAEKSVE